MNKACFCAAAALALISTTPAFAVSGTIASKGRDKVIIWKDEASRKEAMSLIKIGANKTKTDSLVPMVARLVPNGSRAITTAAGMLSHDILVVDGEQSGCRGTVSVDDFKMD